MTVRQFLIIGEVPTYVHTRSVGQSVLYQTAYLKEEIVTGIFLGAVATATTNAADVTSDPLNTTGANLLVAVVSDWNAGPAGTLTDNKSNTWHPLTAYTSTGPRLRAYWSTPTSVGTGHTISFTGWNVSVAFAALANVNGGFDAEVGDIGTGGFAVKGGPITPSEDDSLIITAHGSLGRDARVDSSFFNMVFVPGSAQAVEVSLACLVLPHAETVDPTWTIDVSNPWAATNFVFKLNAPAGGGAISVGATAGSYTITGTAVILKATHNLSAASGSYSLTGTVATPRRGFTLSANSGSYSLTGTVAALRRGLVISAASGSYSLTGISATLTKVSASSLAAVPGSYALTGTAATLRTGRKLVAAAGSYTLTGTAAALTKFGSFSLVATAGSYSLTGVTTGLRIGKRVGATSGAYALTGTAVTLREGRNLVSAAGSYSLTGTAVTLRQVHRMAAAPGSYSLTGTAASLVKTAANSIAAAPGSYALTGTVIALRAIRRVTMVPGSYGVTGTPAGLARGLKTGAIPGSYGLTGTAVSFALASRRLFANAGSYALTGVSVGFRAGRRVPAFVGSYTLTGTSVLMARGRPMAVLPGSYVLTGRSATLVAVLTAARRNDHILRTRSRNGFSARRSFTFERRKAAVG